MKLQKNALILWLSLVTFGLAACEKPHGRSVKRSDLIEKGHYLLSKVPDLEMEADIQFGDELRLLGYQLEPQQPILNEAFTLTFYWEVLAPMEPGWKVFIHLDGQKRREAIDEDLAGGRIALHSLSPGQIVKDERTLTLKNDFGAGDVALWMGVFDERAYREEKKNVRKPLHPKEDRYQIEDGTRIRLGGFRILSKASDAGAQDAKKELAPKPLYSVHWAKEKPVIDGKNDDKVWEDAELLEAFVHPQKGTPLPQHRQPSLRMLWDEEALYVSFHVPDKNIVSPYTERDDELWKADVVELYFDPSRRGRNYMELQFSPKAVVFDALFDTRRKPVWKEAAKRLTLDLDVKATVDGTLNDEDDEDRSWTVEVAIPWKEFPNMKKAPKANELWSANFYRLDQNFHAAWTKVGRDYHALPAFGEMQFIAPKAEP